MLTARVKAVNTANAYANSLYTELVEIFKPFVGQKIEKVDGQLLEKVKKLLPKFPCTVPLSVYRRVSDYSLAFTVKTCESVPPNSCTYYEATVYIGDMSNGVLIRLSLPPNMRSDYTKDEIESKREAFRLARKYFQEAQSALYPFDEYDH